MFLRSCCIAFLLLAVLAGLVKFTVRTDATGVLIDLAFVIAVIGFLTCGIGHLGRRLAELAHPRAPRAGSRSRRPDRGP